MPFRPGGRGSVLERVENIVVYIFTMGLRLLDLAGGLQWNKG